tara:strand:- start:15404 stop:16726 length:1323 start_codon:yes stop_codon:yes gene_type:complete
MGLLDNTTQQAYYQGNNYGNYQFTSLEDIINQFIIAYTGENKIIPKVKRTDVAFHAQRALQELSFDTFKSIKSQEITLPPSNTMILPQDYVNYTRVLCVDSSGIKHPLYPTKNTQNPFPVLQNSDGEYALTAVGTFADGTSSIALDSEYKNIIAGMIIIAPSIPTGAQVSYVKHAAGITTVFIHQLPTVILTSQAATETITFQNQDGSLISEKESSVILDSLNWIVNSDKITAASAADASSVKVGMVIDNQLLWPLGSTVIDVNGAVITMSLDSLDLGSNLQITFTPPPGDSTTWSNYQANNTSNDTLYDYDTDIYDLNIGKRYGLEPSHAQTNGSYFIDNLRGLIHFSSNVSGKTIVLDYISDSLGTDGEMQVHKFAEEAMYKSIVYAICSTTIAGQQLVPRFKKEKFAAIRQAKLRLSNIKLEEITQILRGKSKQIKH